VLCRTAIILIHLETKANCLAWLEITVPAQVGGGVRVAAGYISIPGTAQAVSRILPIHRPTIDGCGSGVSNTDLTGRAGVPLVGNYVATRSRGRTAIAGRKHSKTKQGQTYAFVGRSSHLLSPWINMNEKRAETLVLLESPYRRAWV
jgi:hypothetical protein